MLSVQLVLIVFPVFLLAIGVEIYLYRRRGLSFPFHEAGISLFMFLIFQLVNITYIRGVSSLNASLYEHRVHHFDMQHASHWVLLAVLVEFLYYWQHRLAHEVRWFWGSHSVHHSPTTMSLSGAYRLAITQALSFVFVFYFPIFLLGFPGEAFGMVFTINLTYQFWLHTDLIPRLGWVEGILNTPSAHRVHHAVNPLYLDKNYGGTLMIFDRLFGTYQAELLEEPCRYGLVGKERSLNPLKLFFQEWVAIARDLWASRSFQDAYLATFARPGAFQRHKIKQAEAAGKQSSERISKAG